jgi:hypothetical protein
MENGEDTIMEEFPTRTQPWDITGNWGEMNAVDHPSMNLPPESVIPEQNSLPAPTHNS